MKDPKNETKDRQEAMDSLYGGRTEVVMRSDGWHDDEAGKTVEHKAGDIVKINKKQASDAVRHGVALFPAPSDAKMTAPTTPLEKAEAFASQPAVAAPPVEKKAESAPAPKPPASSEAKPAQP